MTDFALLLLRITTAAFMFSHGAPKVLHPKDYAASFEGMGLVPGAPLAKLGGAVEAGAAALIALGLLGPIGPMLLFSDMIVATGAVTNRNRPFKIAERELETLYAAIAMFLALTGEGRWTIDESIGLKALNGTAWRAISIPAGIAGAAFMLGMRKTPPTSHGETDTASEASVAGQSAGATGT